MDPSSEGANAPGSRGATWWQSVASYFQGLRIVVRAFPVTLLWPILFFCITCGVGIWAVTQAARGAANHSQARALSLAKDAAAAYAQILSVAFSMAQVLASLVQSNPQYDVVSSLFNATAPALASAVPFMASVRALELAPAAVVRHVHPLAGNEFLQDLDLFSEPAITAGLIDSIISAELSVEGPMPPLTGDRGRAGGDSTLLVVRQAIHVPVTDPRDTFGRPDDPNPLCGAPCGYNATTRKKFWGAAAVLVTLDSLRNPMGDLMVSAPLHSLAELGYRYTLVAPGRQYGRGYGGGGGTAPVIVESSPSGAGGKEGAVAAAVDLGGGVQWTLYVGPPGGHGWMPSWYGGVVAAVVVLSLAASLLLFLLLISRRRHQMLLHSLLPAELIRDLQTENDRAPLEPKPLLDAESPADVLMGLLSCLLSGTPPDLRDVVLLKSVLRRRLDVYRPLNLGARMREAQLDSDVASALMRQLGSPADIRLSNTCSNGGGGANGETSGLCAANAVITSPNSMLTVSMDTELRQRLHHQDQQQLLQQQEQHLAQNCQTVRGALAFILAGEDASTASDQELYGQRTASTEACYRGGAAPAGPAACSKAVAAAVVAIVASDAPGADSEIIMASAGVLDWQQAEAEAAEHEACARLQGCASLPLPPLHMQSRVALSHQVAAASRDAATSASGFQWQPEVPPGQQRRKLSSFLNLRTRAGTGVLSSRSRCFRSTLLSHLAAASEQRGAAAGSSSAAVPGGGEGNTGGDDATAGGGADASGESGACAYGPTAGVVGVENGGNMLPCGEARLRSPASLLGNDLSLMADEGVMLCSLQQQQQKEQQQDERDSMTAPPPASSPPRPLVEDVERLLSGADSWQFDTWGLQEASGGHALSALGFFLLQREGLLERFSIQPLTMARLLRTLEGGYPASNPYHNSAHAADVLHTLHVLLHGARLTTHYLDPLGLLAAYFAAIVHDYGHPGLANDFLVATSHPLALRYNDRSPLESHHAAAAFTLLAERPDLDVTAGLSRSDRAAFRKQVIELVLATDMKQHFAILNQFNTVHRLANKLQSSAGGSTGSPQLQQGPAAAGDARRLVPPPNSTDDDNGVSRLRPSAAAAPSGPEAEAQIAPPVPLDDIERLLTLQVMLKAADIGHLGAGLERHKRWLAVLEEEFFRQGDKERQLGLPISPLFDRAKQGVSKSQVGFFDFVALPLIRALAAAFPGAAPLLQCFQANYRYWRQIEAEAAAAAAAAAAATAATADASVATAAAGGTTAETATA